MISKINVTKFGLYNSFSWDDTLGKTETFKRLNIIYGRNYSGKTTLSRIFKCFEDSLLHKDYLDCGFTVDLSNGTRIDSSNLNHFGNHLSLRVYNSDFIKENLAWLHNVDGTIKPFTILGAKNVDLDKKIQELQNNLGSIEEKSGLLYDKALLNEKLTNAIKQKSSRSNLLRDKLKSHANDKIKVTPTLFQSSSAKKNYQITDIENDIAHVISDSDKFKLSSDDEVRLIDSLKETALPDVGLLPISRPKFKMHFDDSAEILKVTVSPSAAITELLNDTLLQEWVRQGVVYHEERSHCGFCGSLLPRDLWSKLGAHFNKESDELRERVRNQIDFLVGVQKKLNEFLILSKSNFYRSFHDDFEVCLGKWNEAKQNYNDNLSAIIGQLREREKNIFSTFHLPELNDESENIYSAISDFNFLIGKNNLKTSSLSKEQTEARKQLRLSDISNFLTNINYKKELELIDKDQVAIEKVKADIDPLNQIIAETSRLKDVLENETKDERRGADLINQYLNHFFGHDDLKLTADGDTSNMAFTVTRDGEPANNLSEGECSLISFCYFIAKIQDELSDTVNQSKLVIYIDDPISSLDSNHIFFMFSLIEAIIAKPKKYCQLFISTHNLDFLKYLKQLTIPKCKHPQSQKDVDDLRHFVIERHGKDITKIRIAPDYLKKYVTEFNYLFGQIHQCSLLSLAEINEHHQYNFGNNMRKFLEAHLFFKYPNHNLSLRERIAKYFDDESITVNLINRVINEYSHIGEQFERGMVPIDIQEIQKVSIAVMKKMETDDANQFNSLVASVA